jgi:hypothetical protein
MENTLSLIHHKSNYITDINGNNLAIILPIDEYDKIIDLLDEFYCIKDYDKAKNQNLEFDNYDDVIKDIIAQRNNIKQ